MQKFEVQVNLETLRDARAALNKAVNEFNEQSDYVLKRLIFEAAANMMSPQDVAKRLGVSTAAVKAKMKKFNLNPSKGKTLLSKTAAETLASNAAMMGIEPHEIDLMSPLAYLPAGKDVRALIEPLPVTSVPDEPDYDMSRAKIEASIILGIAVEQDWDGPSIKEDTLSDEQIEWLASWLAGDGIKA